MTAENNWWGGTPQSSKFLATSNSSIDYSPWLTSQPLFKPVNNNNLTPEVTNFNRAFLNFGSNLVIDSTLTEEEVMSNFDSTWAIKRQLHFAHNLINLNFPESAEEICHTVLKLYPDSSEAFFALSVLWDAGRISDQDFLNFQSFLDSLSLLNSSKEVYEDADLIDQGFDINGSLPKIVYNRYQHKSVASEALLQNFIYFYFTEDDLNNAKQYYNTLQSDFSETVAAKEAMLLLGESDGSNDDTDDIIPKEFRLLGNYPNPFNPETTIKFELPVISKIDITIFNILGQQIRKIEIKNMDAGLREISWDGKNVHGKLMPTVCIFIDSKQNHEKERK